MLDGFKTLRCFQHTSIYVILALLGIVHRQSIHHPLKSSMSRDNDGCICNVPCAAPNWPNPPLFLSVNSTTCFNMSSIRCCIREWSIPNQYTEKQSPIWHQHIQLSALRPVSMCSLSVRNSTTTFSNKSLLLQIVTWLLHVTNFSNIEPIWTYVFKL